MLTRLRGLLRSLQMYYWPPGQGHRLDAFYGQLIGPGDLCFDVGAHVGNRSLAFRRLGAKVIAIEPQPDFVRFLRWLFRRKPEITLEETAIATRDGEIELFLSTATPTVTSASKTFVNETPEIESFSSVAWDRSVRVPALSLQSLIARYGNPAFIKLDIEGMELAALEGLTTPPSCLSFEFLAARPQDSKACLDRLNALGTWQFNVSRGEDLVMLWPTWTPRERLDAWLAEHAGQDFSGDIYAKLISTDDA